jgi:hypothetical protein
MGPNHVCFCHEDRLGPNIIDQPFIICLYRFSMNAALLTPLVSFPKEQHLEVGAFSRFYNIAFADPKRLR